MAATGRPLALLREPGPELVDCELTHAERRPIDVARAREEHAGFVAALAACGLATRCLPPLAGAPDAVFVEDAALVLEEVAVLTRSGAASRRAEPEALADELARHRPLVRVPEPATLDGGDVLRIGDVLHVGQGGRTSHAGLKWLAHAVLEHGLRVKAVSVRGALHLKSVATALSDELVLVDPARVDLARFAGLEVLPVPPQEPDAANVLRVGDAVLLPACFPRTAELLAARGLDVRPVALDELRKAECGVTCLCLVFDAGAEAPGGA